MCIMNRIDKLVEIYNTWGHANGISPLPSADDLRFDALYARRSLTNEQFQWLEKFQRVWGVAEDHEYKRRTRK